MVDELIDIFDERLNFKGKKMKSEAHNKGLWHKVSHVWFYNSKGEILLQKRNKNKDVFPGVWDISAAGHIKAGESRKNGAIREIEEEVGIEIEAQDLEYLYCRFIAFKINENYKDNEIQYIHLYKCDKNICEFKLEEGKVDEVKWISIDKFEKDLIKEQDIYSKHGDDYYRKLIEEIQKRI